MNEGASLRGIHYQPLTLIELESADYREPEKVVEGILPRGSLTLLAGREKSGKSLLVADLAACIAGGEPFLDLEVAEGPVVLVPAEENQRDVWLRLQRRLGGQTDLPLLVLPVNRGEHDRLDLNRPDCMKALEDMLSEYEPVLLILDPMRELHRLRENDADEMGPLLQPLRQLAHRTDTAVVLVHHMSRAGQFRGSTAIRAAADQEWAFHRPETIDSDSEQLSGILTVEGRFGPRQRIGIRLAEDLRWQASVQALSSSPAARIQVLECLDETDEPLTAHQIAATTGLQVKTIQNVLAEGKRKGEPFAKEGTGRKNDPFRYYLPEAS